MAPSLKPLKGRVSDIASIVITGLVPVIHLP